MSENKKSIFRVTKRFEEGVFFSVAPVTMVAGTKIAVECSEGASRVMYFHSRQGLPIAEGGSHSEESIEVKGYLLGTVHADGDVRVVRIKDALQLSFSDKDSGDAAYFSAKDRAALDRELSRRPELQMVGNYHSHPNHQILLSEQDVDYLTQYLIEPYQVAAIVGPRESALGFFLKEEDGSYVPRQEPIEKMSFTDEGKPDLVGDSNYKKPETLIQKKTGPTQWIMKNRRIAWSALAVCFVSLVLIIGSQLGSHQPVLRASNKNIELNNEQVVKKIKLQVKGGDGTITYSIDSSILPPWLSVFPGNGVVDSGTDFELVISANNMADLPQNKSQEYFLNIDWISDSEGVLSNVIEIVKISVINDHPLETELIPVPKSEPKPTTEPQPVERIGSPKRMITFADLGIEAGLFKEKNPRLYRDLELSKLVSFGGPKYFYDIGKNDRARFVQIAVTSKVNDSWSTLVKLSKNPRCKGEFAWAFNRNKKLVQLLFIFPEGTSPDDTLNWLANNREFRKHVSIPANKIYIIFEGDDPARPTNGKNVRVLGR